MLNMKRTILLSVTALLALSGCTYQFELPSATPISSTPVLSDEAVPNTWNLPRLSVPHNLYRDDPATAYQVQRNDMMLRSRVELFSHRKDIPLADRQRYARAYADDIYKANCDHHYHPSDTTDCTKIGHYYPWEHNGDTE